MPRTVPVLLLSLSLAGCNSGPRAAVPPPNYEALREGWIADLENKRVEASVGRYAPDAVFTNPDGSRVSSTAAMRTLFTTVFSTYDSRIRMTPTQMVHSGSTNMAYENGTYAEDLTLRATQKVNHIVGSYLTIYRREPDGRWLILRQSWTDKPELAPSSQQ